MLDVRARGYDLVVLEIAPLEGARRRFASGGFSADALRSRFEALGIPVARREPRMPSSRRSRR